MDKAGVPAVAPGPRSALAYDIRDQATKIAEEIAALLADLPDEQLFGNTELVLRDKVLRLVAGSLTAELGLEINGYHGPSSEPSQWIAMRDSKTNVYQQTRRLPGNNESARSEGCVTGRTARVLPPILLPTGAGR